MGQGARRERLFQAQCGLCAGCGKPLDLHIRKRKNPDFVTIDHVVSLSRGGPNRWGNIVAMHRLCNEMKMDDLPTGCEMIWLLAVNNRLGVEPKRW